MKLKLLLFFSLALVLFSCTNKTEELVTDKLSDYMPLQPGKFIIYRLDSLSFTSFGTASVITRYQVKHEVDAQIMDSQGRPTYRVYTYIRDSAGTQPWNPLGTILVTPLASQMEVTEDNFRVIKLHLPITEGYHWPGNTYLPDDPYYPRYDLLNDNDMKFWDFTYDVFQPTITYRGNTYKDVVTVLQEDDHQNAPVTNVNQFGYNTQSIEKYSKNIGLVYRKYEIWDYQTDPTKHYTGFGITMWMIDHN
jgi:hypothetical protein